MPTPARQACGRSAGARARSPRPAATYGNAGGRLEDSVTPMFGGDWRGDKARQRRRPYRSRDPVARRERVRRPRSRPHRRLITGFASKRGDRLLPSTAHPWPDRPPSGADGTATISSLTIPAGSPMARTRSRWSATIPTAPYKAEAGILVDTTPPTIDSFRPATERRRLEQHLPGRDRRHGRRRQRVGHRLRQVHRRRKRPEDVADRAVRHLRRCRDRDDHLQVLPHRHRGQRERGRDAARSRSTRRRRSSRSLVDVEGGDYKSGGLADGVPETTYYRGAAAGSFSIPVTPRPDWAARRGLRRSRRLAAQRDGLGFSFDSRRSPRRSAGPFVSNPISWVAGTTENADGTISLTNDAGNTFGRRRPDHQRLDRAQRRLGRRERPLGTGARYSTSLNSA